MVQLTNNSADFHVHGHWIDILIKFDTHTQMRRKYEWNSSPNFENEIFKFNGPCGLPNSVHTEYALVL